jgi:hypothetical protein
MMHDLSSLLASANGVTLSLGIGWLTSSHVADSNREAVGSDD